MGDRGDPCVHVPPDDALAWTSAQLETGSTGQSPESISVKDQHGRAYTLRLVRDAVEALMPLALDPERGARCWVVDGALDAPLLVTTTRGVEAGDPVALVAPRTDGELGLPDAVTVEQGSDIVSDRAHVVGLTRWPVWFGPPEEGEVPADD